MKTKKEEKRPAKAASDRKETDKQTTKLHPAGRQPRSKKQMLEPGVEG